MIKTLVCLTCKKTVEYISYSRRTAKFCSRKCAAIVGSKKYWENRFTWSKATEQQALDRLIKLYNERIIKTDDCWGWKGRICGTGYGVINFKDKKSVNIHRVSWMIHNGPIPEGKWVLHKCDNPICSNPDHLFLGTPKDNTQDMLKKRRGNRCRQQSKNAKLNKEQVLVIKKLLLEKVSQNKIAKQFDVGRGAIQAIHFGTSWKDI